MAEKYNKSIHPTLCRRYSANKSVWRMNKPVSSDNLRDAVRKWHAKRKKDFNGKINAENVVFESENTVNPKKNDTKHVSVWNNATSIESNQTSHTNEQKRPRYTEIENSIKYIFDGPLSFDTIMALKRKKSNTIFNNDEKILKRNPIVIEQNNTKNPLVRNYVHLTNNHHIMENSAEEIDIIHSKSINAIQNFLNCNTISEIIGIFECIINHLSISIQELINASNINMYDNLSEKSLNTCINLILHKSNSISDQFDETALEFLAKYPEIFESLKTLTNIEELNNIMPSDINNHILKFNSQIDRVYNLLNR